MGELFYGEAIHIREQAKIDAARVTQKSGNEKRAALTALDQFSASLSSKRALDAAGKNINIMQENLGRALDAAASGSFQQRIAAAEEAGAAAVMASAAGMGGSTVEAYNETMRLSHAMGEELSARAARTDAIATADGIGEVLTSAVSGMDNSIYRADIDYTQYVDHQKMGTFTKLATLGAAAAATVFAGPQAGAAVVGVAEADQHAKNGDFASASRDIMGAVNNGFSAVKDTHSAGGNYWSSAKATMDRLKLGNGIRQDDRDPGIVFNPWRPNRSTFPSVIMH